MKMRFRAASFAILCSTICTAPAMALQTSDQIFASAALRDLHEVARATAQHQMAGKDGDLVGCAEAYDALTHSAHNAFANLHQMSVVPLDAINALGALLRVAELSNGGCPDNDFEMISAGQAILGLRIDFAVSNQNWYTAPADGTVIAQSPLTYAQALVDKDYSWVNIRPKGVFAIAIGDWKAEMASDDVSDMNLANDGSPIHAVEVGYRKTQADKNTEVYFYSQKEDAIAASKLQK